VGMMTPMTREVYDSKQREKHGAITTRRWANYPNSVFYYKDDGTEINGATENIGIYTDSTTYSLEPA